MPIPSPMALEAGLKVQLGKWGLPGSLIFQSSGVGGVRTGVCPRAS